MKSKAVTEQFGNLSTSKNCWENAFRIAKGFLVFTDREKLKAWKEHYEKLLNEEFPWDINLLQRKILKKVQLHGLEKMLFTQP